MKFFLLILAGIAGGVIGGMGMGGGTLLIPLLTIFFHIPQIEAQAINLVAFIPMALIAVFIHARNKLVDFKQGLWVVVPALVSTVVCSLFVNRIEGDVLRRAFGGFLIALGIAMLVKTAWTGIAAARKKKKAAGVAEDIDPQ